MESISYTFNTDDQKLSFTTASDTKSTSTETLALAERRLSSQDNAFPSMEQQFTGRSGDLLHLMEPRPADSAPTPSEINMMNYRINDTDSMFGDSSSQPNYYMGGSRTESVSSSSIQWGDSGVSSSSAKTGEIIDTFDFLVKSLSSANNYVSMLTRDQLSVLRSIRPSLLYELLQEVAKARGGDKRARRPMPNECAFCKNNGENEECYSTHVLKDVRGRVLCPILRAFRCPRCGATGDRAHTIKYCSENNEAVAARRRGQPQMMRGQPLMMQPMGRSEQASPSSPVSSMPGKPAWWSYSSLN